MKTSLKTSLVALALLAGPAIALAAGDSDADRSHPVAFVKDSAITTKVKTKLAADHLTSLGRIHVDTDMNGIVWLTGSARSQEAIDKAVSIAKGTEHVKSVHNDLVVKKDDLPLRQGLRGPAQPGITRYPRDAPLTLNRPSASRSHGAVHILS